MNTLYILNYTDLNNLNLFFCSYLESPSGHFHQSSHFFIIPQSLVLLEKQRLYTICILTMFVHNHNLSCSSCSFIHLSRCRIPSLRNVHKLKRNKSHVSPKWSEALRPQGVGISNRQTDKITQGVASHPTIFVSWPLYLLS